MKKIATLVGASVLAMSSFTANAQINEVKDAQLAEVDGQILLALAVATVEAKKHDAILRVAQSLDLAREVHETTEDVARLAALGTAVTAGVAYVGTEIVIGEILGEVLSIEEDFRTKLNLFDAFRPFNG
jgi:fucose permease